MLHSSNKPKKALPPKAPKISRREELLRSEIKQLSDALYNLEDNDAYLRFENLKTYCVELIRSFILYTHLAIEDILRDFLVDFFRHQRRSLAVRRSRKFVQDLRSLELIEWCYRLKLITTQEHGALSELNRVRNACAHNWLLDIAKTKTIIEKATRRRRRIKLPPFVSTIGTFSAGPYSRMNSCRSIADSISGCSSGIGRSGG